MPTEMLSQLGHPAERNRFPAIDRFILGTLLLVLVLLALNFASNRKLSATQDAGVVRGYINRAVTCDLQKGLGLHESKGCADPVIAPYRDAATGTSSSTGATESRKTRELVCLVLQQAQKDPRSTVVIPPSLCTAP